MSSLELVSSENGWIIQTPDGLRVHCPSEGPNAETVRRLREQIDGLIRDLRDRDDTLDNILELVADEPEDLPLEAKVEKRIAAADAIRRLDPEARAADKAARSRIAEAVGFEPDVAWPEIAAAVERMCVNLAHYRATVEELNALARRWPGKTLVDRIRHAIRRREAFA
jgi:hypothetical protein